MGRLAIRAIALGMGVPLFPAPAAPPTPDHPTRVAVPGRMADLQSIAGPGFRLRDTEHFLIAYDTDYDSLRPLLGRLDATFESVDRFLRAWQFHVDPLSARLPVILFRRYEDFSRYSQNLGVMGSGIAGFYHQSNNVAAFCHMLDSPPLRRLTEQIQRLQETLNRFEQGNPRDSAEQRENLRDGIAALRLERDAFATKFNRTVIQHEAAHQVLYNLGIHVRGGDNPLWLVEGLACQFEVPQTDSRGGLGGINHLRLADFREALRLSPAASQLPDEARSRALDQGRLTTLVDLVQDRHDVDHADANVVFRYAQSWALVYYLVRQQPEAFADYLRGLQARRRGEETEPDTELAEFRAAFGEPDRAFERGWVDFVLRLRFDPQEAGR